MKCYLVYYNSFYITKIFNVSRKEARLQAIGFIASHLGIEPYQVDESKISTNLLRGV